jgi:hypothetical protein
MPAEPAAAPPACPLPPAPADGVEPPPDELDPQNSEIGRNADAPRVATRRLERLFARRVRELAQAQGIPILHVADRAGMARSYFF